MEDLAFRDSTDRNSCPLGGLVSKTTGELGRVGFLLVSSCFPTRGKDASEGKKHWQTATDEFSFVHQFSSACAYAQHPPV